MSKPKRYDPAANETKWQSRWENEKTYACHVDKDQKKYICAGNVSLPSGNLHMACTYYSIGRRSGAFQAYAGFNVMAPMEGRLWPARRNAPAP